MNDLDVPIGIIRHDELLSGLKALAVAHLAGGSKNEFSDGLLTGLAAVATLTGIERQFEAEAIRILRRQPKLIEVK